MATNIFINEIHYDNAGTDTGEAIEIAGPAGTDLTGWSLVLYNGNGGAPYRTAPLAGSLPDQGDGFGTLSISFPTDGIQNGSPDGIVLVDSSGSVVQFLSYEGVMAGTDGPASGVTSTDIGVSESNTTPLGQSLQLAGDGQVYEDFTWQPARDSSPGEINTGQAFGDGGGTGGEEPMLLTIPEIQGAAHLSAYVGMTVRTAGVVTAVDGNGFFLQDPDGDDQPETSDGIFVFTGGVPAGVTPGDAVALTGSVAEFTPGGAATGNLSITQITGATNLTVTSTGNTLPAASVIGPDGRLPPTETIDDDNLGNFDPAGDGIDFFESLEGMRVTVQSPVAVSGTNDFGEIYTVVGAPGGGLNATNLSARGTLNIEGGTGDVNVTNTIGGDFNPERIQIDDDADLLPGFATPNVAVGDRLGDVTGVVTYNFGNYEVAPTQSFSVAEAGGLERETSTLKGSADELLVASYNVLNLDPNDADGDMDLAGGQFDAIARQIVDNLNAPDIIGLQEIQDNDGSTNSAVTSASLTLQTLADAISAAGGPDYEVIDNPFIGDDTSGGQPGGNIRTAFLYNPDRVGLVEDSLRTVTDPADQQVDPQNPFYASRLPLAADFTFNGETVTVVSNHFTSKGGSTPLFGRVQPPVNGGEEQRAAQAQLVNDFVDGLLAANPDAKAVVLGDLNEFEFEEPLRVLEGDLQAEAYQVPGTDPAQATVAIGEADQVVLTNLTETLPEDERYSYLFEGNSQSLDHILVTGTLAEQAVFDAVHVNSEFAGSPSDHDPILARLTLGSPGRVIEGTNKADVLLGGAGADTIKGGNGKDLLEGAGGADLLEGGNGADTLIGGAAADTLLGGNGPDVFVFAPGSSRDAILDFGRSDSLSLRDGLVLERREEVDTDADGRLDTVLTFGAGVVVTLFDVSGLGNSLDLLG